MALCFAGPEGEETVKAFALPAQPIIYFAGPAQHSLCSWFSGHHVLESYANLIDKKKDPVTKEAYSEEGNLSRYRATFASMALDPGAYSNMTAERRGEKPLVTIDGYIKHAVKHGAFFDWCASYDDITGGPDGNRRNWERCKAAGIPKLMPVFHQGEPWSLLEEYCAGSQYVGLGMQRPFENELAFLDGAFSRIPEGRWVHIFAGTSFLEYPATSWDSTTWKNEMLDLMRTSGQGHTALRHLTQPEMLDIVLKSYPRRLKQARYYGTTFGIAAGRGEQVDLDEALSLLEAHR